jgi:ferredoxin--NADP+ reductase
MEAAMNARLPSEATLPPLEVVKWYEERVIQFWHWTPRLVSLRISRNAGFRFVAGRYARLGLFNAAGVVVWRPFSMVSGASDEFLEFLVILIEGGEFSQHLAALKVGNKVLVDKASFGFLTLDQLAPGESLWLFASGTGLGPFLSILHEQMTWRTFKHIVLVHSVRNADDLVYRDDIEAIGVAMPTVWAPTCATSRW